MNRKPKVILPGSTIGVLGGGQLGRMMALQGSTMGYRFMTIDPTEDSPCGQVASRQIVASYDDVAAAMELAQGADVITYEFENVDAGVAAILMQEAYVPQGSRLLEIIQHRLREKQAIEQAGIQVAPYYAIENETQLRHAVKELGFPCVLKTVRGGYDGKGQWIIRSEQDISPAFQTLSGFDRTQSEHQADRGDDALMVDNEHAHLVCEQFIPFSKELSVIAARSTNGEIKVFPVAENIHRDNILHQTIVPARVSDETAEQVKAIAIEIVSALQVVGLIAVECFLTATGEIYVNELAPRPHNSGHYTIEACSTSQFEQHIRAICGLPLASTDLLSPAVMVNILGEHVEDVLTWLNSTESPPQLNIKTHFYGKHEAKQGRKMGHLNILTPDIDAALHWIAHTGIWDQKES